MTHAPLGAVGQNSKAQTVLGAGGVALAALVAGGVGYLIGGKEWALTGALVGGFVKGVLLAQKGAAT